MAQALKQQGTNNGWREFHQLEHASRCDAIGRGRTSIWQVNMRVTTGYAVAGGMSCQERWDSSLFGIFSLQWPCSLFLEIRVFGAIRAIQSIIPKWNSHPRSRFQTSWYVWPTYVRLAQWSDRFLMFKWTRYGFVDVAPSALRLILSLRLSLVADWLAHVQPCRREQPVLALLLRIKHCQAMSSKAKHQQAPTQSHPIGEEARGEGPNTPEKNGPADELVAISAT